MLNKKGKGRAYGVYRAMVTGEDPNGGGRVKVRSAEPALPETWARVATLQLPAKGEEVVSPSRVAIPGSRTWSARCGAKRATRRLRRASSCATRMGTPLSWSRQASGSIHPRRSHSPDRPPRYPWEADGVSRHVSLQRRSAGGHRDHEQCRRVELHPGRREHLVTGGNERPHLQAFSEWS
jgi:hypothetical protein